MRLNKYNINITARSHQIKLRGLLNGGHVAVYCCSTLIKQLNGYIRYWYWSIDTHSMLNRVVTHFVDWNNIRYEQNQGIKIYTRLNHSTVWKARVLSYIEPHEMSFNRLEWSNWASLDCYYFTVIILPVPGEQFLTKRSYNPNCKF